MKSGFYSGLIAGAMSLAVSFPALADITAREVLDELVGYYESVGYDVSIGSENMSGDTLTVSDMSVTLSIPDKDGQVVITSSPFSLINSGDGSVALQLPDSMTSTIEFVDDGETKATFSIDSEPTNFQGRISGSADNLSIETGWDSMVSRVASVVVDGELMPMTANLNFGKMAADYGFMETDDDRRNFDSAFNLKSMDLLVNVKEPGGEGFLSLSMDIQDIISKGVASMAVIENLVEVLEDNPFALFGSGFIVDGDFKFGASNFDMAFKDRGTQFALVASSSGGAFDIQFTPDVVAYSVAQQDVAMNLTSSDLPIPAVKFDYEEASFSISVPLSKTEEPGNFHAKTAVRNLSVSEAIWSMIDPGQSIPRDPATVAIDVSGKVMVLANLMDMETLENLDNMDGPPMLPVSATLNELLVSFGGALLTGDGSARLDLENGKMMGGMPMPIGEINLSLKGGFGLMDKLAAMGLIPPDASMGIRAMLGAFAKPVGDDHFETTIEMTEEGAILANGQRIQ